MREGDLVYIHGKVKAVGHVEPLDKVVIGTFLGHLTDKQVMVLLSTGVIYVGPDYHVSIVEQSTIS